MSSSSNLVHSHRQPPLVSLADIITVDLGQKSAKLSKPIKVSRLFPGSPNDLFRLVGAVDRAGYTAELQGGCLTCDRIWSYGIEWINQATPLDHWTAMVQMFPRGTVTLRPNVMEVLQIIAGDARMVRRLLKDGHRLAFLGDTGMSGGLYIGLLTLERGRFCFGRVRVSPDLVWGPKDLFLVRVADSA